MKKTPQNKTMNIWRRLEEDSRLFWWVLGLLGLMCAGLMAYITRHGIGVINDSVLYVLGARNLLAGNGYVRFSGDFSPVPITNFPPLYSLTLALLSLPGLDPLATAQYFSVFLFAANVMLMGFMARKITASNWFGWLAAGLMAVSEPLMRIHTFAMTDGYFLLISFGVLFSMANHLKTDKWGWIALSGLLSGLAFITRYVGAALFGTVLVMVLLFRADWRKKLSSAGIYLAAGLPLALAWMLRNQAVQGNVANRQAAFHLIPAAKIEEGMRFLWEWLLPDVGGLVGKVLPAASIAFYGFLAVTALGSLIWIIRTLKARKPLAESQILGISTPIYMLGYLLLLVLTLLFLDASPIFEAHIMFPVYTSILILLILGLKWVWDRQSKGLRVLAVVFAVGLGLVFAEDTYDSARTISWDGQGFASTVWMNSETINAIRTLPEQVPLYSNKIMGIQFLTNRPAFGLPSPINPATDRPREGYDESVQSVREAVLKGEGYMAIFNYKDLLNSNTAEDVKMMQDLGEGMPVLFDLQDGVIFGLEPKQ
ncbi:MAG: phospholipid carrier-dependent glycosyltransferase [Chloroflexi bacterium]|nr:phospholipid carrier-dependent glycosyltransferase [Chloroflexota bacterium]